MDTEQMYQRGIALRRQSFGDGAVASRMNALGEFGAPLQLISAPLQLIINAYSYGDVWRRPDLALRSRSLAMIAVMATLGKPTPYEP